MFPFNPQIKTENIGFFDAFMLVSEGVSMPCNLIFLPINIFADCLHLQYNRS